MGPAPDDEGAPSRGGLQRFRPRRRHRGAPVPDDAARTVATAPSGEAESSGEEPVTRISATGPARPRDDAPTVAHSRPVPGADDPTVVHGDPATEGLGDRTAVHHGAVPGAGHGAETVVTPPAGGPAPAPAPAGDIDRMRVPGVSPLAPVAGWLAAWGLAALAAQCAQEAGVGLGQGLGIAEADGAPDGLWNGIWLLGIQGVAWLLGGYVAARMARGHGTRHALLAWVLAMLATAADSLTGVVRDGYTSVLAAVDLPSWIDTGLGEDARTAAAYAVLALAALLAALIGGGIGQGANALARRRARA